MTPIRFNSTYRYIGPGEGRGSGYRVFMLFDDGLSVHNDGFAWLGDQDAFRQHFILE